MRTPLMAGNWKMYKTAGQTTEFFQKFLPLIADAKDVEIVIGAPFVNLPAAVAAANGSAVGIGAQDVFWLKEGAYTGEVSAPMIADIGCKYVIIGHSERRQYHAETDAVVNAKARAAIKYGITPIVCVGEGLDIRKAGEHVPFTLSQLDGSLEEISPEKVATLVVAYEPVWAIGTGVTASPEQAESAHEHLRKWLARRYNPNFSDKTRILYGGSVKPDNALALLGQPNVDGALVGGASLKAATFVPIIEAARKLSG